MSRLPWDELIRQWTESRTILSDLLGEAVTTASVSDGYYSAHGWAVRRRFWLEYLV